MQLKNKYVITVVGTTAIGKTTLGIKLANYFNGEIISADSRQFFKEMQIGTAVPTEEELRQAKHHFIQNLSIFDNYSVGDFEKDALKKIEDLHQTNDFVILVGGSGLYLDAVLNGLDYFPKVAPSIREKLKIEFEIFGLEKLQNQLKALDPKSFESIKIDNPQRVIRALEICIGTGKSYSSFLNVTKKEKRNFKIIKIGLSADRSIIYDRINKRVDIMIKNGLIKEAQNLFEHRQLNALQTVGYKELFSYFDGNFSKDFAIEEIKKNTRRFAKRQITWFKRGTDIVWFNYKEKTETITKHIEQQIK